MIKNYYKVFEQPPVVYLRRTHDTEETNTTHVVPMNDGLPENEDTTAATMKDNTTAGPAIDLATVPANT